MISIIAAIGKGRVLGKDGAIPWHLPADFAYFKKTTLNHPIIMGRRTFESIGKPLPDRTNIILSTQGTSYDGTVTQTSLKDAIAYGETLSNEVFVIGGARVYADSIDIADRIYLTYIDGEFAGDTFFPEVKESEWIEISRDSHDADERNEYGMVFVVYDRKK